MKSILLFLLILNSGAVFGKEASSEMKTFNKSCPASKLCKLLDLTMHKCSRYDEKACAVFVDTYKKLVPEYDCQRTTDKQADKKWVVPALWLCEDRRLFTIWISAEPTKSIIELFASDDFRKTLDGSLAQDFEEKSKSTQKKLGL